MDEALRALNRFGLGARVGEPARVGDPRAWLLDQLRPEATALDGGAVPTPGEIAEAIEAAREARGSMDREASAEARRGLARILSRETAAAFDRRVRTDAPFVERLVSFWSNHLCVSVAGKQPVIPLAGAYEREVIRPHVLGRFEDMVLASARHPAMLLYLDNFRSIGPDSRAARAAQRRAGRERGLNENYARELLELHTLGVDGGYSQADVEALARILTGWTLEGTGPAAAGTRQGSVPVRNRSRPGDRGSRPAMESPDENSRAFVFRPLLHEPGEKRLLGRIYGPGGAEEGESAIRDLCAHPGTADFLAGKLARHFVADDPPPEAVRRIASVFRESGGDLLEVSRVVVDLDETWDPDGRKLRTPQDWLVAVLRAVDAPGAAPTVGGLLRQLRHPLWAPPSPKGYGDTTAEWADPDALMNRAELAHTLAQRLGSSRTEPERLLELVDEAAAEPLRTVLNDPSIPPAERFALVIGGPAFQWR